MLLCIYYNSVVAILSSEKKGYALRFGGKIVFFTMTRLFFYYETCLFKIIWGWIGNFILYNKITNLILK